MILKKNIFFIASILLYTNNSIHADPLIYPIYQEDVQNGLIIAQSGTWQLQEDITCNGQFGISIASDNVSLDLNGHTISTQEQCQQAIIATGNVCTISNGTILGTGSVTGIVINSTEGSHIVRITCQGCATGISITGSNFTFLSQCTTSSCSNNGIVVQNSPATTIKNCLVQACESEGIIIGLGSTNTTLNQVGITAGNISGARIDSDDVTVTYVVVTNSKGDGIVINGNNVSLNTCSIARVTGNGCTISGSNTQIQYGIYSGNSGDGIRLTSTSSLTQLTAIMVNGNQAVGINNFGATSNRAFMVSCSKNVIRDFWRIVNIP